MKMFGAFLYMDVFIPDRRDSGRGDLCLAINVPFIYWHFLLPWRSEPLCQHPGMGKFRYLYMDVFIPDRRDSGRGDFCQNIYACIQYLKMGMLIAKTKRFKVKNFSKKRQSIWIAEEYVQFTVR
jgi:hypothetical protein